MSQYRAIEPCENHGAYYCKENRCQAIRQAEKYNFTQGVDPGDDQDFIDQHKNKWPKYEPQWKNRGMK